MKNNFTEKTRELFIFRYDCDMCGSNQNLELHHIFGRVSDSPLNASLLCHSCHYRHHSQKPFSEEEKIKLIQKEVIYLKTQGYKLTEKDKLFMIKYKL